MINLNNMKEIRLDNDVSQTELSKILNVTRNALAKWETGSAIPSFEVIYNFARYFRFSIDYVLGLSLDCTNIDYKIYDPELISKNIRYLRTSASLTQRELASKLNLTCPAIARYEKGASKPSINVLYNYCKFFKISFHQLVTLKDEK